MKIKVSKPVTEEFEVSFPMYKKTSAHFMKAISETKLINVCDMGLCGGDSIDIRGYLSDYFMAADDSNAAEFDEAFNRIKAKITNFCYPSLDSELDTEVKQDRPESEVNNER